MQRKKTLSILLAIILIFISVNIPAYAVSTSQESLQETYQRQLDDIQSSAKQSDTDKVSQIVNLFFNAKIKNYTFSDIDLSIFLDKKNNTFESNKTINSIKLREELLKSRGVQITSDKLELTINNITVYGDKATVSLYELYKYQLSNVDLPSSRGITCTVSLSKINNKWLIASIASNDEFVTDAMGSDTFDAKYQADELTSSTVLNTAKVPSLNTPNYSTLSTFHAINRNTAAIYAYNHATSATYSRMFPDCTDEGGDCANFGSQCVWAGCGGTTTSINTYYPPMYSGWYSYNNSAPGSWKSVSGFYGASVGGGNELYAVNYGNDYRYARPGDILQLYSGGLYYHTYVVYAVTGSYGSRTINDIYICSHTSDRLNECLADCWSGLFRHIMILGVNY